MNRFHAADPSRAGAGRKPKTVIYKNWNFLLQASELQYHCAQTNNSEPEKPWQQLRKPAEQKQRNHVSKFAT